MADIYEKDLVKAFALAHSGELFQFYDDNKYLPTMKGRVVGFYYALALLVIECDTQPLNPIDPIQSFLDTNGALLIKGSFYCLISMNDIIQGKDKTDKVSIKYPNTCPRCSKPAYVGITPNSVDCSSSCKF